MPFKPSLWEINSKNTEIQDQQSKLNIINITIKKILNSSGKPYKSENNFLNFPPPNTSLKVNMKSTLKFTVQSVSTLD